MSESGQGGDQRSWWEKPDEATGPRSAADAETTAVPSDAGDPYRQVPTQSVPQHPGPGASPVSPGSGGGWSSPHEQPQPPQWGGQDGRPPAGYPPLSPEGPGPRYGQPQDGYAQQQGQPRYAGPQPGGSPYGASSYGPPHGAQHTAGPNQTWAAQNGYPQQAPVAGAAHAVLWTAVGGLLLVASGLGWIAAVVALALVPGARRSILESGGARRGLGYLLAGKVVAWTTIGLTVVIAVGLAILIGVGLSSQGSSSGYDVGTVSVLLRATGA